MPDDELRKHISPAIIANVWKFAKENYIGKGVQIHDAVSEMAGTFKMGGQPIPERVISFILDEPKSLRKATSQVRERQRQTAQFLAANKKYLANLDATLTQKLWDLLDNGVTGSLLAQHGPVVTGIHAIDVVFNNPVDFAKAYFRGVGSLHEDNVTKYLAKMTEKPEDAELYQRMVDAGFQIRKEEGTEGFKEPGLLQRFANVIDNETFSKLVGHRSWSAKSMDGALKPLRMDLGKRDFLKMIAKDPELNSEETLQWLADVYNHGTGAMAKREPIMRQTSWLRRFLLAGQLTPSKWMRAIGDPAKAINIYQRYLQSKIDPKTFPLGERAGEYLQIAPPSKSQMARAHHFMRRTGFFMGSYLGALTANQVLLKAAGSNQDVNFMHPERSDWLAFKFAGHYWRPRGSMEVVALLMRIAAEEHAYGKLPFGRTPEETFARYGEYKLKPVYTTLAAVGTGRDVFGRPQPWSSLPGTARFPRLTWPEAISQKGPIFLGHAVQAAYDGVREMGVPEPTISQVFQAIYNHPFKIGGEAALEGGAEFFGINVQRDLMRTTSGRVGAPAPPKPPRPPSVPR